MTAAQTLLIVACLSASFAALADVRVIAPERHSLLPATSGDTRAKASTDPGALKPKGEDAPSPILVEQTAWIDATGKLVMGCGDRRLRDFRSRSVRTAPGDGR